MQSAAGKLDDPAVPPAIVEAAKKQFTADAAATVQAKLSEDRGNGAGTVVGKVEDYLIEVPAEPAPKARRSDAPSGTSSTSTQGAA